MPAVRSSVTLLLAAGAITVALTVRARHETAPQPLPDSELYGECHRLPEPHELDGMSGAELALAQQWRERHDCGALPACAHPDPVAELRADLDDTPGVERVIANNRFGAVMYAASGAVIAVWGQSECGDWPDAGQELRLEARRYSSAAHADLVLRTHTVGHCGELGTTYVLANGEGYLETLATIDEEGRRGCNTWTSDIRVQIAPAMPGVLAVRYDGTRREATAATGWEYGPPAQVHAACAVRLDAEHSPELDLESCR